MPIPKPTPTEDADSYIDRLTLGEEWKELIGQYVK
jgi:hypothetical protein